MFSAIGNAEKQSTSDASKVAEDKSKTSGQEKGKAKGKGKKIDKEALASAFGQKEVEFDVEDMEKFFNAATEFKRYCLVHSIQFF
jgi:hypothetical protein